MVVNFEDIYLMRGVKFFGLMYERDIVNLIILCFYDGCKENFYGIVFC